MSQPEVRHGASLSESDYCSQSTSSVHEQSIERSDSFKSHNIRKPRLSISLSPPIIPSTTKDISTQTDDKIQTHDKIQTLLLPPEQSSEEASTKRSWLKNISVKRSSSYDAPQEESTQKTDEKASSCSGVVFMRRNDTVVDSNTVRKHKRSKSLKLTLNKRNI